MIISTCDKDMKCKYRSKNRKEKKKTFSLFIEMYADFSFLSYRKWDVSYYTKICLYYLIVD